MNKQRACMSLVLAVLMLVSAPSSMLACAISVNYSFSWTLHPSFPVSDYSAGRLGVILPSFARSYLVVAYRYLSGKPLSTQEQQVVNAFVNDRVNSQWYDTCGADSAQSWLKARSSVPGVSKIDSIELSRTVGGKMSWSSYCNCQKAAFDNAAETLSKRIAEFGINSPQIKDWVAAQDLVFANCSGGKDGQPQIPAVLGSDVPNSLRQDRAYQIAAAQFYAQQFEPAQAAFAGIVSDVASPYGSLARYLAVRTMIRQATLIDQGPFDKSVLIKADEMISPLLNDPAMAAFKDSLLALQRFVKTRITPEARLQVLGRDMCNVITADSFDDYIHTFDSIPHADPDQSGLASDYMALGGEDDLTDWIVTFQTNGAISTKHALDKWRTTQKLPWLLCALAKVDPKDENMGMLLSAAAKVDTKNPGYEGVSFFRAVGLMELGKLAEAEDVIGTVYGAKKLDLSSKNMFQSLQVQLAQKLEQFLAKALAKPAGVWGGGQDEVPWSAEDLSSLWKQGHWFLPVTQLWLDHKLPLPVLRQAALSSVLPQPYRNQLAQCVWVRAVLLGDETTALQLAPGLKNASKKWAPYYSAYLAAKSPAARKFAGAFLMLHNDESDPSIASLHEAGEHWWWSTMLPAYSLVQDDALAKYDNLIRPTFVSAAQVQQGEEECKRLKKTAPPGSYLPQIVVNWAKTNPGDSRLPEALSLAVRCTRYAVRADGDTNWSKEAFRILHQRYPKSIWAEKTKFWY